MESYQTRSDRPEEFVCDCNIPARRRVTCPSADSSPLALTGFKLASNMTPLWTSVSLFPVEDLSPLPMCW